MDRIVQIFVEGQRVELFKDEQISINLSVQNISDLDKTFTDFTQSFQVPASPSNNQLFKHFYNSDVDAFNGVTTNPNLRRNATIEIDNTPFRTGKLALEKANITNSKAYSYTCTFYGDLISLKDTFKEKKFIELDWTSLGFDYTYQNIKARIKDGTTDYDVRYPLIASTRYWQYGGGSAEDISTPTGAILWSDLFPAVKLSAILTIIESNLGVTFQGGFLQTEQWKRAFMLFKNKDNVAYISPPIKLLFTEFQQVFGDPQPPPVFAPFDIVDDSGLAGIWGANSSTGVIRFTYFQLAGLFGSQNISDFGFHNIDAVVTNVNPDNTNYYFDIFSNGAFHSTVQVDGGGNQTVSLWVEDNSNNPSLDRNLSFAFRSDVPMAIDVELVYYVEMTFFTETVTLNERRLKTTLSSTDNFNNLATTAPDMKIADWFSNILKMFNLTCYGVTPNVYEVQTLEEWYNEGQLTDITEHVNTKTINLSRIKLFNAMGFKFAPSESILNKEFKALFFREYGDLVNAFDYDGGQYDIEVPFENLMFNKFDNTNLQVGYNLKEDLSPYVPKPIIMYRRSEEVVSFYLTDNDTQTQEITTYVPFGQDTNILNQEFSLNFKTELSSFTQTTSPNALYNVYYKTYLENLYNPKNREVSLKAILPLSIVTGLKLNDRLTIRDKRYIINNIKLNLTNGEADLTLVQDFRRMISDSRPPIAPPITPDPNAQCFDQFIPFVNNAVSCTITSTTPGVTITPSTITEAQNVTVCIPANPSPLNYLITETFPVIKIGTEQGVAIVTDESVGTQVIVLTLVWNLQNGLQVSNQIFINQQ